MDARTPWRTRGRSAVCVGVILAACTVAPARADSLSVRLNTDAAAGPSFPAGSPAAEFGGSDESRPAVQKAGQASAVGGLLGALIAGTVLYEFSPDDFSSKTDNPLTTDLTTPKDTTTTTKDITIPKDGKDTTIIQGNPTPEPASLVIGLIGAACGGAAVWRCRNKKAAA